MSAMQDPHISQHIKTCPHGIPAKACKTCCGTWITHEALKGFVEYFSQHTSEPIEITFEDPIEYMAPGEFQEWYSKYWPLTM
jgi:Tfp pilus assembly pilus retraction ATPase PilT